jgi:hypothetical protein
MSTQRYIVQGPDGKRYIVEGPSEAAAPQQAAPVAAPAQPTLPAASEGAVEPAFARAGGRTPATPLQDKLDAVRAGVADASIRGYVGLKQLIPGVGASEQDQAVLAEMAKESEADPRSGYRTGGNILGSLALAANPASAKAILPIARAAAATKFGAVGAGAAGSGAAGLLFNPGEGKTQAEQLSRKVEQSGKDAAFGGALGGAGRVLRKALADGIFKPTTEAVKLFDQGINPTLQQGAEGKFGKFVGGLASGSVGVRNRQEREIEEAFVNRVAGGVLPGGPSRKDNLDLVQEVVGKEYETLLKGKRFYVTKQAQADALAAANVMSRTGQFKQEAVEAQAAVQNILGDLPKNAINSTTLQREFLLPLSTAAQKAKSERAKRGILAARDVLIGNVRDPRLSADELDALKKIDIKNYDVNRFKEAAKGAGAEKEGISVARLEGAYSKAKPMVGNTTAEELIGPATRVIGVTPNQEQARSLMANIRRGVGFGAGAAATGVVSPGIGMAAAGILAPAYLTSIAGQTAGGARRLMGQGNRQKQLAELLRNNPDALDRMSPAGYVLSPGE